MNTKANRDAIVTCNDCGGGYVMEEALREREVEGYASVTEIGLCCPNCQGWTHAYFMNAALRNSLVLVNKRRQEVHNGKPGAMKRYQKAHKAYKKQFDRMNAHLREKLGVESPKDLAAAQQN